MRKSKWSDDQLEELLRQMPKIKDDREPVEIYQNIEIKIGKRKQNTWILPAAAAAAALFLFFLLAPSLLNWKESAGNSIERTADKSSSADMAGENSTFDKREKTAADTELKINEENSQENASQFAADSETESKDEINLKLATADDNTISVYEEDLEGKEVLTYAIPDQSAQNIVPVSVLVAKDSTKSKFDLFEENMSRLTEEDWGLSDYYPLKASFSFNQENRTLTVDVPKDHPYSMSSTTETQLQQVLASVMNNLNIQKINLATEGQTGIEFSHFGNMESFTSEKARGKLVYYFLYPNGAESKPFMVPLREELSSIKEAFTAMKKNQEEANLRASIPEEINFEAKEIQERKLLIRFENESEVNDDESTLYAIEAILLTAKEFNFETVKLENADADKIGKFDLETELKVPVAANKRELPN